MSVKRKCSLHLDAFLAHVIPLLESLKSLLILVKIDQGKCFVHFTHCSKECNTDILISQTHFDHYSLNQEQPLTPTIK